jgi:DedD protein
VFWLLLNRATHIIIQRFTILATQFQNRLIGTVILVSLGVIFLPDLLMGKKNDIAAPAGSMPLRPEQSLAAVSQQETAIPAIQGNISKTNNTQTNSGTEVVAASNVSTTNNTVTPVRNNENWKVDEVAGPVTITESAVVSDSAIKTISVEKQKTLELATAKTRELELKKKEGLLEAKEAAKAKDLARIKDVNESTKEIAATNVAAPISAPSVEPVISTTIKRDESGLLIKTAAQVEAERAAKSTGTTITPSGYSAKPVTTAHSGSWIIQVGVFSNAENAQALAAKLRSSGFGASTLRAGQMTRVFVGPDVSKEKLQSMLSKINQASGTSARVIPYAAAGN